MGFLGNQKANMNGKLINKMIQEEDLILLNDVKERIPGKEENKKVQ